jgi:hypothetical protein
VIQDHPASPSALAQLVNLAASLDLAEVEPQVRKLQLEEVARAEPLGGVIRNHLAFRNLHTPHSTAVPASSPRRPLGERRPRTTLGKTRQPRRTSA